MNRALMFATAALATMLAAACDSGPTKTIYELAAAGDDRDDVTLLVEEGGDVNQTEESNGRTPLHAAAANGHVKMCNRLIALGADVNAQDDAGMTPLHLARAGRHDKTAGVLIAAGADMSITNDAGHTAADLAK